MIKKIKISLGTLIALCAMSLFAYYILVCDNAFHSSVSSIISWSHQLSKKMHLAVLTFIPVYIAIIIFGTAILGIYLGSVLQGLIKGFKARTPQIAKSKS
jgi:hypothetical protein